MELSKEKTAQGNKKSEFNNKKRTLIPKSLAGLSNAHKKECGLWRITLGKEHFMACMERGNDYSD